MLRPLFYQTRVCAAFRFLSGTIEAQLVPILLSADAENSRVVAGRIRMDLLMNFVFDLQHLNLPWHVLQEECSPVDNVSRLRSFCLFQHQR